MNSTLQIPDLTEEMREELAGQLPNGSLRFEQMGGGEKARDLVTTAAIVTVSLAALRVLAVWIARHIENDETEISVQTQQPDGSFRTLTYRSKRGSSKSEAEVLKELAAACKVDLPKDVG